MTDNDLQLGERYGPSLRVDELTDRTDTVAMIETEDFADLQGSIPGRYALTQEEVHMVIQTLEATLDDGVRLSETSRDELPALVHRLWTHWSQHIAAEEGISEHRLARWEDLWVPFDELDEADKQVDRDLANQYLVDQPDYDYGVTDD